MGKRKQGEGQEIYKKALEIKKKEPELIWSAIGLRLGVNSRSFGSEVRRWAKRNNLSEELEKIDINKKKKF